MQVRLEGCEFQGNIPTATQLLVTGHLSAPRPLFFTDSPAADVCIHGDVSGAGHSLDQCRYVKAGTLGAAGQGFLDEFNPWFLRLKRVRTYTAIAGYQFHTHKKQCLSLIHI